MTSIPLVTFLHSIALALVLHPMHVSVTEIEFDEKSKALEMTMRIFADDLETTMRKRFNRPTLDIMSPPQDLTIDQMMSAYITEHYKISLDNKIQRPHYLGHERDGDAFVFYIEVTGVKKWKTITITNDVLHEMFDDQSNMVHVTVRGQIKSLRLTKAAPQDKLTFDGK